MSASRKERFLNKCYRRNDVGCWLWTELEDISYGQFEGKLAHRVSYELFTGPIPDGKYILHKCDIPACVNPDHLYAGTQSDNMKDRADRNRMFRNGKKPFRKYSEKRAFALTEKQAADLYKFSQAVGEYEAEYIRTAIEQRNKREARRRSLIEKMRELK